MDLWQKPYRIPDSATPAWREAFLQLHAEEAARAPEIMRLAGLLMDEAIMLRDVSEERLAQLALAFMHEFVPYRDDPAGEEWYQGALYTLSRDERGRVRGGDCEDLAVVLAALLIAMGLRARVLWQNQQGAPLNHVTTLAGLTTPAGVVDWRWADPTVRGAALGEEPLQAAMRTGQLHEVGVR